MRLGSCVCGTISDISCCIISAGGDAGGEEEEEKEEEVEEEEMEMGDAIDMFGGDDGGDY